MRIIARLDIKNEKLIKGVMMEGLRVLGNASEFAYKYQKMGVSEIFYVDNVASLYGRNNLTSLIKEHVKNCRIPVTVGGGISSIDNVYKLMQVGADKIVINTSALNDPKLIKDIADIFGSQAIAVSIQTIKIGNNYELRTHGGREKNNEDIIEWIKKIQDLGCGEIFITAIHRDGTLKGPELDIAVDPLEGTNFAANNLPGALSVLAISEKNNLFSAPETYMEKISTKIKEKNIVDLDYSIKKNIMNLSDYLNKKPEDLTACILDRPRHNSIIEELKKLKVKIKYISDGDVSGALLVTEDKYNVDIYLGIGGGPEGVLAAAALDTFGCSFQGRFLFETDDDKIRANKMGIKDLNRKYEINEIVSGDTIFCATGITSGDLVSGIKIDGKYFISETLVTHKSYGFKKIIKSKKEI